MSGEQHNDDVPTFLGFPVTGDPELAPVFDNLADAIDFTNADVGDLTEVQDPWSTGVVRCRVCNHEHVSVWPIVDENRQECPHCGHMACGPVEDDDAD